MTFEEYQKLAIRTLPPANEPGGRLETLALGLCGEMGEFLALRPSWEDKAKQKKELGDIGWYVASLMHRFNNFDGIEKGPLPDFLSEVNKRYDETKMVIAAMLIADIVKKHTGHLHNLDVAALAVLLPYVKDAWMRTIDAFRFSFDDVADANIAKLRKRYPNGFTVEASINRVE